MIQMPSILEKLAPVARKIPGIRFIYHQSQALQILAADRQHNYYKNLSPEKYPQELAKWYHSVTGKQLNLDDPRTFDEKIQWMKLYDSTPLKTQLADKYLVRDYIKEKIGEEYLIPLLGVWDSFDEIDFDTLPNQFVLKANHGSGWNIIVRDKSTFDKTDAKKKFDKWMKTNFAYKAGLELHYKDIQPKIIAEEYIENDGGNLYDYKVHCFGGKAVYIQYIGDRATHTTREGWFNKNWTIMSFTDGCYPKYDSKIPVPHNLLELLSLSELLASHFSYVRVDFYVLNDSSFKFGEMTFTPASGVHKWFSDGEMTPDEVDLMLGCLIPTLKERNS